MSDGAQRVREDLEVGRLTTELATKFQDVPPELIEHGLRSEFDKRADFPVQDFVPIFVERSVRGTLRSLS